ncbi:helix-turn-helix domain-containing protein [Tabrizicola flagellatus]|uniref:helix-turn-helix domain-containing protein n=1 Tax=Tabrizicola flagellatus TaxID=2593021 RepID=UPI00135AF0BF|nr:helix-turn-helix domain-containing protein [Tabrizicola flagellatus]
MSGETTFTTFDVRDRIAALMRTHGVRTRSHLARRLGVSKNTIRNWEIAGRIPDRFVRGVRPPVQVTAALAVLRDLRLSDADARSAAVGLLSRLESAHD